MADGIEGASNEALLDLQIQTFYQVNRFISSIHDMDQLLILIMQESESAVNAEASCIALLDQRTVSCTLNMPSVRQAKRCVAYLWP